ncbi:synaptic vesicle membrane protein VAT-1-like isoform X2, partial [Dinothrombium tinctorium]
MTETTGKTEEQKDNAEAKAKTENGKSGEQSNETDAPAVKEMKAIVVQGFGGLKSVKVLKKPEPTAAEGEVVIRVKACGLNFPDLMLRQGVIDNPPKTPFILGFECAGIIETVGEGVEGLKAGDRVAALTESRAYAELVNVSAKYVYKLPDSMSFKDAVGMTMNYVVAYCLLFDVGNLRNGQTVLVHSAGGGVGQAVAQLCKTLENITLIGTASKHKHDALKDVLTHVLDHSNDYVQEIRKLSPEGVDLVLDCLCGDDANKGYNLLKPLGRYVLYAQICSKWWQVDKISPMKLYEENKSISGFNLRHLLYQQNRHEYIREVVNKVYKLFEEGKVKPVIDSSWAFEDIPEAMQKLHDRKNIGKIVLDPEQEPKPRPPEEETEKGKKRKSSA